MFIFVFLLSFLSCLSIFSNPVSLMGRKTKALDALVSVTGNPEQEYTFTPLKGGQIPFIYKVTASKTDKNFLVRFTDIYWQPTRKVERAMQEYASAQGFGPELYYQNTQVGILVMEFLERKPMAEGFRFSTQDRQLLAHLLKSIHATTIVCNPSDGFTERVIPRVNNLAQNPDYIEFGRLISILRFLNPLLHDSEDQVVIHGDLHPENVFFQGDHYKAIDFESVRTDSLYVDLATIANNNCTDQEQEKELLTLYFGHEPTRKEWIKFIAAKCFSLAFYGAYFFENCDEKNLVHFKQVPYFAQVIPQLPTLDLSKDEVRYWVGSSMFKEIERLFSILQNEYFFTA